MSTKYEVVVALADGAAIGKEFLPLLEKANTVFEVANKTIYCWSRVNWAGFKDYVFESLAKDKYSQLVFESMTETAFDIAKERFGSITVDGVEYAIYQAPYTLTMDEDVATVFSRAMMDNGTFDPLFDEHRIAVWDDNDETYIMSVEQFRKYEAELNGYM